MTSFAAKLAVPASREHGLRALLAQALATHRARTADRHVDVDAYAAGRIAADERLVRECRVLAYRM